MRRFEPGYFRGWEEVGKSSWGRREEIRIGQSSWSSQMGSGSEKRLLYSLQGHWCLSGERFQGGLWIEEARFHEIRIIFTGRKRTQITFKK